MFIFLSWLKSITGHQEDSYYCTYQADGTATILNADHHCAKGQKEFWRTLYWLLNAIGKKLHRIPLLRILWPELVTWHHLTTEEPGFQSSWCQEGRGTGHL